MVSTQQDARDVVAGIAREAQGDDGGGCANGDAGGCGVVELDKTGAGSGVRNPHAVDRACRGLDILTRCQ